MIEPRAKKQKFSLPKLGRSFRAAASGLGQTLRTEQNLLIHLLAIVCTGIVGWWLDFSTPEWLIIVICIVAVVGMELMNTALEYLCDIVRDRLGLDYQATKYPRDIAAAAVLVTVLGAVAVGSAIVIPKLLVVFGF